MEAISKMSEVERCYFPLYCGLAHVQVPKKAINAGSFVTYVSTSWEKGVAQQFRRGNEEKDGLLIVFSPEMQKKFPSCDVSWISKFPLEREILFARSQTQSKYDNLELLGTKQWQGDVVTQSGKDQTIILRCPENYGLLVARSGETIELTQNGFRAARTSKKTLPINLPPQIIFVPIGRREVCVFEHMYWRTSRSQM